MNTSNKINYVEFGANDLPKTRQFFELVFGWQFEDYGPDYTAFSQSGIDGGFFKSSLQADPVNGSALLVIYASDLAAIERKIVESGGLISKAAFDFPGGRRFHFKEPSGNELAVWSDV